MKWVPYVSGATFNKSASLPDFNNTISFPDMNMSTTLCVMLMMIPGLRPANERRRYKVTPSLIGWAQT